MSVSRVLLTLAMTLGIACLAQGHAGPRYILEDTSPGSLRGYRKANTNVQAYADPNMWNDANYAVDQALVDSDSYVWDGSDAAPKHDADDEYMLLDDNTKGAYFVKDATFAVQRGNTPRPVTAKIIGEGSNAFVESTSSVTKDISSTTQTTTLPKKSTVVPKKTVVVPKKTVVVPKKTVVVPKKTVVVPKKTVVVPKKTVVVPKKTVVVPKKTVVPQKAKEVPAPKRIGFFKRMGNAFSKAKASIKSGIKKVKTKVIAVKNKLTNKIKAGVAKVKNGVAKIKTKVKATWNKIKTKAKTLGNKIKTGVKKLTDKVKNGVQKIKDKFSKKKNGDGGQQEQTPTPITPDQQQQEPVPIDGGSKKGDFPEPTPTPEPTPEPMPEPEQQQKEEEPMPEPTPEPTPEPMPEPEQQQKEEEPMPEPTPEPMPEPMPEPTPEPMPEPMPTPDIPDQQQQQQEQQMIPSKDYSQQEIKDTTDNMQQDIEQDISKDMSKDISKGGQQQNSYDQSTGKMDLHPAPLTDYDTKITTDSGTTYTIRSQKDAFASAGSAKTVLGNRVISNAIKKAFNIVVPPQEIEKQKFTKFAKHYQSHKREVIPRAYRKKNKFDFERDVHVKEQQVLEAYKRFQDRRAKSLIPPATLGDSTQEFYQKQYEKQQGLYEKQFAKYKAHAEKYKAYYNLNSHRVINDTNSFQGPFSSQQQFYNYFYQSEFNRQMKNAKHGKIDKRISNLIKGNIADKDCIDWKIVHEKAPKGVYDGDVSRVETRVNGKLVKVLNGERAANSVLSRAGRIDKVKHTLHKALVGEKVRLSGKAKSMIKKIISHMDSKVKAKKAAKKARRAKLSKLRRARKHRMNHKSYLEKLQSSSKIRGKFNKKHIADIFAAHTNSKLIDEVSENDTKGDVEETQEKMHGYGMLNQRYNHAPVYAAQTDMNQEVQANPTIPGSSPEFFY